MEDLSRIAKPLYELTTNEAVFQWGSDQQSSFEKTMAKDISLQFPDTTAPFYFHFDSSNLGTGAVLQQKDKQGYLRPLEFFSRKWTPTEYNYATPDKELFGLILALQHWHHWLYGVKEVNIYTDHKGLRDFSHTQLLKPRHARWALVLEDYRSSMKIHWIPGYKNK